MTLTQDNWLQRAVAARERVDISILREALLKLFWFTGLGKRDQELMLERISSVLCSAVAIYESAPRKDSFDTARKAFHDLATVLKGLRIVRSRITLDDNARTTLALATGNSNLVGAESAKKGHQFWLAFDGQIANATEATDRAAELVSKLPTGTASYPGLDEIVVGLANLARRSGLRVSGSENKASFVEFVRTALSCVQGLPLPSADQIDHSVRRLERVPRA
jgi:hypothetical protein